MVQDWYRADYYKISSVANTEGPNTGVDKVIRGGGWAYNADSLRCAHRGKRWARVGGTNISMRIAFDPKPESSKKVVIAH